ncbi:NUDIX hydrolase [Planotetraspora phitsanulokensis]|uniref:DNA mismatch repair protein MutT n=1 Tax=Planotetraspora phitsanulokensis TaxID=575192 RepID=A0A8J3UGF3_9ACTN|nr:DNA mismatch repair protein MutT [Planotetraspora phitsanulokensis]
MARSRLAAVPGFIQRPSARLLLADDNDRLLLFSSVDATWFTPGGGVDEGEPLVMAAVRELREETGFRVAPEELGPVVATASGHWRAGWDGRIRFSVDSFFFLRVPEFDVSGEGLERHEADYITGHRWWSLEELRATEENVLPWGLAGLLERLYAGEIPAEPVRLPWHHPEFAHLADAGQ